MHGHHRLDSLALVSAPSDGVLTVDQVRAHLRIDDCDDPTLQSYIDAAVGMLDPAAGGTLGRALRPQTWELRLPGFHGHGCHHHRHGPESISLPYPPLISVVSLTYQDMAGADQTLAEGTDFRIVGMGARGKCALLPIAGWPQAAWMPESVRIRFQAGYPAPVPAASDQPEVRETLPAPITAWLKLVIGTLYQNREAATTGRDAMVELPDYILQMINPHKVY
jgi:uncharacterized phiE125 gp8 family phage protein